MKLISTCPYKLLFFLSSILVWGIDFQKLLLVDLIDTGMIKITGYISLNPGLSCENIAPKW